MRMHRLFARAGRGPLRHLSSPLFLAVAGAAILLSTAQTTRTKPRSSDFYVSPSGSDRNDGSATRPWLTIAHAAGAVRPGATVHVAPGVYTGSLVTSVSGTAEAHVRFLSETRWAARIKGVAGNVAAWQNRGDYVDILGFDVSGPVANGIENLGSFTRIIGNRVHDMAVPCDENGGAGINNASYEGHDNDVAANLVFGVRPTVRCAQRHGVGIYHSNARGQIYSNIVCCNGLAGIQLWHAATAVMVANNTIFNNGANGIIFGAGDARHGVTNDHSIVINNISVNNGSYGIQEFGSVGTHNIVSHNLVNQNAMGDLLVLKAAASATITRAPGFVRYTGESSGDYHLNADSPAVDAAISEGVPIRDFDGASRPAGRALDIGAYETAAAPASWPWR